MVWNIIIIVTVLGMNEPLVRLKSYKSSFCKIDMRLWLGIIQNVYMSIRLQLDLTLGVYKSDVQRTQDKRGMLQVYQLFVYALYAIYSLSVRLKGHSRRVFALKNMRR